jgi:Zn-dependent protease with chaperone function
VETPAEAISLLRTALPWWAVQGIWLPALAAAAGCAVVGTWAAIRVAAWPLSRLTPDGPWYERARGAHPAQAVSAIALVFPAVTFGVLVGMSSGPLLTVPRGPAIGAIVIVALLGSAWPRWRFQEQRLGRRSSLGATLRDDGVALLLIAPHLVIAIALASALRPPVDALDVLLLALATVATGVTATRAGLPALRWLGAVRPASPRLRTLVLATAERLGVAVRDVEEVEWSIANAFALPLSGRLVFTGRCAEVLDDDELCAIAAHELGHLSEPAAARAARFLAGFLLLPFGAAPLLLGAYGWPGLAVPLGVLLLAVVGLRPPTRHLEVRADDVARRGDETAGTYARALEKLYRDNAAPVVAERRRAPHPDLYDRMLAAGIEPSYPRPAPPSRAWKLAGGAISLACTLPPAIALLTAPMFGHASSEDPARAMALSVAIRGDRQDVLGLAMALDARDDLVGALSVARAATALYPDDVSAPALEAMLRSRRRECAAARSALEQAAARARDVQPPSPGDHPSSEEAWLHSARAWVETCAGPVNTAGRA